jgi:hypothetical protein
MADHCDQSVVVRTYILSVVFEAAGVIATITSVLSMSFVELRESAAHDNSDEEIVEESVAVEAEAVKNKTTFYSEMMRISKQLVAALTSGRHRFANKATRQIVYRYTFPLSVLQWNNSIIISPNHSLHVLEVESPISPIF